jgi:hypothetical protein
MKQFQIGKKLSITLSAKIRRFVEFVFVKVSYDRFLNYNFEIIFFNIKLRITYENTEQLEALERMHKTLSEMGDE